MTDPGGRVYGGRTEAERRSARRVRLVQTGLELFGTEGWEAVTIEALCAGASVATRSFYEEFPGREALIRAVYDEVVHGASQAVVDALKGTDRSLRSRVVTGVGAYIQHLTEDPRRARIAYREVRAVGNLADHRHRTMIRVADLLEGDFPQPVLPADPARRRVRTLALAGAVSEVLVDWVAAPEPRPELEPLLAELTRLFAVVLCDEDDDRPDVALA